MKRHDEVELHAIEFLLGSDACDSGFGYGVGQFEDEFIGAERLWDELSAIASVVEDGFDDGMIDVGKDQLFKGCEADGDFFRVSADTVLDLLGVPGFPAVAIGEVAFASVA